MRAETRFLQITIFLLGTVVLSDAGSSAMRFQGEISDSPCAMNVHSLRHSHEEMIENQTMGTDAASCARACVRRGGQWVLRSANRVYQLKNQAGLEEFSGQSVEVWGSLDRQQKTIDNTRVRPKVKSIALKP
jgi:hypothetical protein